MTTLLDEGDVLVVRCDSCRRLWPIARERLDTSRWTNDSELDLHGCPACDPSNPEPASDGLLEALRLPVDGQQVVELGPSEPGGRDKLGARRLGTAGLHVRAPCRLERTSGT